MCATKEPKNGRVGSNAWRRLFHFAMNRRASSHGGDGDYLPPLHDAPFPGRSGNYSTGGRSMTTTHALYFFAGLVAGAFLGVLMMCLMALSGTKEDYDGM